MARAQAQAAAPEVPAEVPAEDKQDDLAAVEAEALAQGAKQVVRLANAVRVDY